MTDFQQLIVDYLSDKSSVSTYDIAKDVFPDRWSNSASRGAIISQIQRAAHLCAELGIVPNVTTSSDTAYIYLK